MSEVLERDLLTQLPLTNAVLGQNLDWLANISVPDLLELREKGLLADLRHTIASNIENLSAVTMDDLSG